MHAVFTVLFCALAALVVACALYLWNERLLRRDQQQFAIEVHARIDDLLAIQQYGGDLIFDQMLRADPDAADALMRADMAAIENYANGGAA